MSNYPAGAQFDDNAPYNEKEPRMIRCTQCNGEGEEEVEEFNGTRIEKSYQTCSVCNGDCEIEEDLEEEW